MNKYLLLAFILTMSSSFTIAEEAAEVRLIDTITVRAPDVTLGEIATIDTDDEKLRKKLINLVIDTAPNVERPKLISSFKIKRLLEQAKLADNIVVHGSQSSVSTETRAVTENEIAELIRDHVQKQYNGDVEVQINFIKLPHKWHIPAGERVSLKVNTGHASLSGFVNPSIRAIADDRIFATTRARIQVSLFRETLVLVRPAKRGEKLTNDHFEVHRVDVTNARGLEITDLGQAIDMEAKRDLKVGHLVTVNDLQKPILIERGSINRIIVKNKTISMSISGSEALQDGREGDTILFSNPMNKNKPLRAKVVREGIALLTL